MTRQKGSRASDLSNLTFTCRLFEEMRYVARDVGEDTDLLLFL